MIHVLVVEDRADNTYFLRALLEGHGYAVTTAENGQVALEAARARRPDLVVSDLLMPVLDGYALLRAWRGDPALRDVPFVVYTATYTEPQDEQLALDLGADAFLVKPTEPEPLLACLRATLLAAAERGTRMPRIDVAAAADRMRTVAHRKLDERSAEVVASRRRLEAEHAELRMLERAIRCVPQGIVIADAQVPGHPVVYVSPSFERIVEAPASGLVARPLDEVCARDAGAEAPEAIRRALAAGGDALVELSIGAESPSPRHRLLHLSPVLDEGGATTHFAAVLTDVTERRRLEAEARHAQKIAAVGQLAAGIAHDFNNILSIVLGYSSLLLHDAPLGTPLHADLLVIQQAGERAAELTRQLLAFSRSQVQKPRRIDVAQVVGGLEGLLRRVLGPSIELVLVAARPSGTVYADPAQIEQVLLALVVNAREAMPEGGRVTIETGTVSLEPASASGVSPGRWVTLTVADTGVGIPPQVRERIFEPFFTTKERGRSAGLGLSTVLGIVEQSGGRVTVESEPSQGTQVRLLLPRLEGELEEATPPAPKARGARRDEVVLLAEDEDAVRHVVRVTLERHGFRVLAASSGEEALALAAQTVGTIHLLLTDVVMPGIQGRELAERLTATRPETKVLFMSGYNEDAVLHRERLAGGAAFLPKPFRYEELLAKVEQVLGAGPDGVRASS